MIPKVRVKGAILRGKEVKKTKGLLVGKNNTNRVKTLNH